MDSTPQVLLLHRDLHPGPQEAGQPGRALRQVGLALLGDRTGRDGGRQAGVEKLAKGLQALDALLTELLKPLPDHAVVGLRGVKAIDGASRDRLDLGGEAGQFRQ